MIDCRSCDLPNQTALAIAPCQQAGPFVYKDPAISNLGTKQIPLLHLVYEICTSLYGPQAREVRKTWLAVKYSKVTNQPLLAPKHSVSLEGATKEVHHLIGMVLAQRAHFLPIWAQLSRQHQLEVAQSIASLLKGEPLDTDRLSKIQAEMFKGSAHLALQGAAEELRKGLEISRQRCLTIAKEIEIMEPRRAHAMAAIDEHHKALAEIDSRASAATYELRQMQERQNAIRSSIPWLFEETGELKSEIVRAALIDFADLSPENERGVYALVAEFESLELQKEQGFKRIQPHLEELARERERLASQRHNLAETAARGELFYDRLEQAMLDFTLIQLEFNNMSAFAIQTQKEAQPTLQAEALKDDYALQQQNYADPQECVQLVAALQASGTAREIFLFMDPRLKYTNDSKAACRLRKFLSAPPALAAFQALDDANLIQPGPFAKLGVFIINALSPGSYDQRHRLLVQRELEMMVQGMQEHGMDPTIRCHSCGTTAPSGKAPVDAASDWIRDHNPPTALYKLGSNIYHTKLGLPDYAGNGQRNGQILLPQCRECSKRQGAVTAKVVALIEDVDANHLANPFFDLLGHIKTSLDGDDPQDWPDFQRLVCAPMAGWSNPDDLSGFVSLFNLPTLVVTGNAGSFTGIDEAMLKNLGKTVGCHTCTDVRIQNDPYRNIFWIADHQPPTALVARGLMELPQVVYPHCWDWSETQSKMVARLCRVFESCFGKDFKKQWVQVIKDQAWQNMFG